MNGDANLILGDTLEVDIKVPESGVLVRWPDGVASAPPGTRWTGVFDAPGVAENYRKDARRWRRFRGLRWWRRVLVAALGVEYLPRERWEV